MAYCVADETIKTPFDRIKAAPYPTTARDFDFAAHHTNFVGTDRSLARAGTGLARFDTVNGAVQGTGDMAAA